MLIFSLLNESWMVYDVESTHIDHKQSHGRCATERMCLLEFRSIDLFMENIHINSIKHNIHYHIIVNAVVSSKH